MPKGATSDEQQATLMLNLVNGRRAPFTGQALITIFNGDKKAVVDRQPYSGPDVRFLLPFQDGPRDRHRIVAWVENHMQTGFGPVRINPGVVQTVSLMLVPDLGQFTFAQPATHPGVFRLLSLPAGTAEAAKQHWDALIETEARLAAFSNIATAMAEVQFADGTTPIDYYREVTWEGDGAPKQDRFFGFADKGLIERMKEAVKEKRFQQVPWPHVFHAGATRSYKQVEFDGANLQFTFHENAPPPAGSDWVKVEADMDYYKDLVAHTFCEVLVNTLAEIKTDPRKVYPIRWTVGQRVGRSFAPPFVIG